MISPVLFCLTDVFFVFAFVFCRSFRVVGSLPWCCEFFLRDYCFFCVFVNQNSSVVFVAFLLLWFSVCCSVVLALCCVFFLCPVRFGC